MTVPESRPMRPAYRFYQWAWASLDWLYPPKCSGCGRPGTRWCADCAEKTPRISPPLCQLCGQMQEQDGICHTCRVQPPHYAALRSWAIFSGPLRQAVHQLKYRGNMSLGEILARPLVDLLDELNWEVDLVAPVPLGLIRQNQRGYNQAALIARPLALGSGLSYRPKALWKARDSRSQVGLTARERLENVSGAFQGRPKIVRGKSILVIDDVITSGATIDACAAGLRKAGAKEVYGLSLARAVLSNSF